MLSTFDTLPLHPRPRRLESHTSYLVRLAEANCMPSVDAVAAWCFPERDRRVARGVSDIPPLSFGALATLAACPVPLLVATTFFHLGTAFCRSTHPQPLSRFLASSLGAHLRYCPACVDEQGYYSLAWRFTALGGCVRHKCALRDTCESCERPIPLFVAPLRLGVCPACASDLRGHRVAQLDERKARTAVGRQDDLDFLLSPSPYPAGQPEGVRRIGLRLATERRHRGLRATEMAGLLGTTLNKVEGMERGNVVGRGASLDGYLRYAGHLGIAMRDLFAIARRAE